MQKTVNLELLHPGQEQIARDEARFKIVACGRRFGKTRLGAALCFSVALYGQRAWWVAPSYPVALVGWRLIYQLAVQLDSLADIDVEIRRGERAILFNTGGEIRIRSADNPDSLRGEGLDFVVLDECAFMKEDAWTHSLRPALSDRQGSAMFISTPKGQNWFYRLWLRGNDPEDTEWSSWRFPTSDNPYIAPEEIVAARKGLPERIYQQEYLALFLEDAGGIFRGVMRCATSEAIDRPINGRQYIAGVDIGLRVDFTVISIFDVESREQVYMDRFNQVPYSALYDRLEALHKRFNLQTMIIEDNSIGLPPFQEMQERGLPVLPFHTTNATKQAIIQGLAAAFEHREIKILNDPVQVGELQAYEGKRLAGGGFSYGAPDGLHDDTVMAMAIVWQGLSKPAPFSVLIDDIDLSIYKSKRTSIWDSKNGY